MMGLLEAILLGLVQGLTEFLPISSSAHVQIAQELMGLSSISKPQLTAFIATIQLGTELAVILYFFRNLVEIAKAFFQSGFSKWSRQPQNSKLAWLIIVGTVPVVVLGLLFENQIENDVRQLWVIGVTLIVFGVVLGIADRFGRKTKAISELNFRSGLIFGLGQALALIPGVSRSGGSITAGLFLGFTREAAARYSFLLAVPAVVASGLYQFISSYQDLDSGMFLATAIATLVAFISGYAVIAWLLRYLVKGSYMPFVIWRIFVGTFLLVALSLGSI